MESLLGKIDGFRIESYLYIIKLVDILYDDYFLKVKDEVCLNFLVLFWIFFGSKLDKLCIFKFNIIVVLS